MYFSQSTEITVPTAKNMFLYNLEEQFIVHPLNIESQHQPWRKIGKRIGVQGTAEGRIQYQNSNGGVFNVRYDIPMSPRRLHYDPFPFNSLQLRLYSVAPMSLTMRVYSAYPEVADYDKKDKMLSEHQFKLFSGMNVLSFSLEKYNQGHPESTPVPYLSGIEIEFDTIGAVEVYAPICEVNHDILVKRLRERYAYWLNCINFDLDILNIHQLKVPVISQFSEKLNSVVEEFNLLPSEKVTSSYLEDIATLFCQWPRKIESLLRLSGLRTELEYIEKRLRKLPIRETFSQCLNQLLNEYNRLRSEIFIQPEKHKAIDDLKLKVDKLEEEVWGHWSSSGCHARRDGKVIFSAEGDRMSLMGINDYDIGVDQLCNEDDYLYMRLLGYRLIRMPLWYKLWDEEANCFKPHYVEKYLQCVRWAAKYGLNVIFELHYIPECIMFKMRNSPPHALFFDAIECEAWLNEQLALFSERLKDNPSLAIIEVPSNEPYLHENCRRHNDVPLESHSITCNSFLMHRWNMFLKKKYEKRENLLQAWSNTVGGNDTLIPTEDWDDNSIMPPGCTNSSMTYSARLYDYILWFQAEHNGVCQRLAETVKRIAPGKLISMAQASHSGIFSLDPTRLDGIFFYQNTPDIIDLATIHYNLGECKRLSSMSIPGYAGEEYGQEKEKWEWAWKYGCGVIPWGWSTRWRKGEDLIDLDENGYVWEDKRHLSINQQKYLKYPPAPQPVTAILSSKRLITRGEHLWRKTAKLLDSMNLDYDLLDQDLIVDHPELLDRYQFVIFENKYADPNAVRIIAQSKVTTLFIGEVGFDSYARFGHKGLLKSFKDAGLFIAQSPKWDMDEYCFMLDKKWKMGIIDYQVENKVQDERLMFSRSSNIVPDMVSDLSEISQVKKWVPISVPASWTSFNQPKLERAWLRKQFDLPSGWLNSDQYSLQIGGIDDFDWTFINGNYAGGEQITWNQAWRPDRIYDLSTNVLEMKNNQLCIRIQNCTGLGGIWEGPIALLRRPCRQLRSNSEYFNELDGYKYSLAPFSPNLQKILAPESKALALLDNIPLIVQQSNKILFLGDNSLYSSSKLHYLLIKFAMSIKNRQPEKAFNN